MRTAPLQTAPAPEKNSENFITEGPCGLITSPYNVSFNRKFMQEVTLWKVIPREFIIWEVAL